jgi:hypothetical protein
VMRWLIFSTQPSKARGSSTLASAWPCQGATTRGKASCHHSQSNPAKHSVAHCMSVHTAATSCYPRLQQRTWLLVSAFGHLKHGCTTLSTVARA